MLGALTSNQTEISHYIGKCHIKPWDESTKDTLHTYMPSTLQNCLSCFVQDNKNVVNVTTAIFARGWRRECNNYINTKKLILPKAVCLFYKIPCNKSSVDATSTAQIDQPQGTQPTRLDHQVIQTEKTYSMMLF